MQMLVNDVCMPSQPYTCVHILLVRVLCILASTSYELVVGIRALMHRTRTAYYAYELVHTTTRVLVLYTLVLYYAYYAYENRSSYY